jgi:hypothetical protein
MFSSCRLLVLVTLIGTSIGGSPCCSWDNCGACGSTTDYCKSSKANCVACSGKWCPTGAAGASGYDMPNVCDPNGAPSTASLAYACMDWNVGSAAMVSAQVKASMNGTHFFGVGSFGGDGTNMGKCYEVSLSNVQQKGLFQVINQGGDVSTNQFDLQMGDGGFGLFDGCAAPTSKGATPMFAGSKADFGTQYGGWTSKADCAKLPSKPQTLATLPSGEPSLNRLCELSFELGVRIEGGENPKLLSATRVPCPASLVALTGLRRTDEAMAGNETAKSSASGMLTRMMDCCKPSAGWVKNVAHADPSHPGVIPCTADGYTRVKVGPSPAPAPPAPTPSAPTPSAPTPAAPTPAGPPSGCPGGTLAACIGLCPSNPPAAYQACVGDCVKRCS